MENKEVMKKWERYGMLDGLPECSKIKLVDTYEFTLRYLTISEAMGIKHHENLSVMIFPVLRRLIQNNEDINFAIDQIQMIIYKLNAFIESDEYKASKSDLSMIMCDEDSDAELLNIFCERYGKERLV